MSCDSPRGLFYENNFPNFPSGRGEISNRAQVEEQQKWFWNNRVKAEKLHSAALTNADYIWKPICLLWSTAC